MKKRKPPLILASILVLLVLGTLGANSFLQQNRSKDDDAQPQPSAPAVDPNTKPVGNSRTPTSQADLQRSMKEKMGQAVSRPDAGLKPQMQPIGGAPTTDGPKPSAHLQSHTDDTGKDDPNRTSSHWYDSNAAMDHH